VGVARGARGAPPTTRDDGDFIILVGVSGDALNALTEFVKQVYQDWSVDVGFAPIT